MFVCEMSFRPRSVIPQARRRFEGLVDNLIAPLVRSYQVCGDTHAYWSKDQFKVLCKCPREDSLDEKTSPSGASNRIGRSSPTAGSGLPGGCCLTQYAGEATRGGSAANPSTCSRRS